MTSGAWIVTGAAVGGGIGAFSALLGGSVERHFRARRELAEAGAEWLAAADMFVHVAVSDAALSVGPTNPVAAAIDDYLEKIVDVIGRSRVEGLRMLVHRGHVERVVDAAGRVEVATTRLLLASPRVLVNRLSPHIATLNSALQNASDPEAIRRWRDDGAPGSMRLLWLWSRPAWQHPIWQVQARLARPPKAEQDP